MILPRPGGRPQSAASGLFIALVIQIPAVSALGKPSVYGPNFHPKTICGFGYFHTVLKAIMLGLYSTRVQESEDKIAAWATHWSVDIDFGFFSCPGQLNR